MCRWGNKQLKYLQTRASIFPMYIFWDNQSSKYMHMLWTISNLHGTFNRVIEGSELLYTRIWKSPWYSAKWRNRLKDRWCHSQRAPTRLIHLSISQLQERELQIELDKDRFCIFLFVAIPAIILGTTSHPVVVNPLITRANSFLLSLYAITPITKFSHFSILQNFNCPLFLLRQWWKDKVFFPLRNRTSDHLSNVFIL